MLQSHPLLNTEVGFRIVASVIVPTLLLFTVLSGCMSPNATTVVGAQLYSTEYATPTAKRADGEILTLPTSPAVSVGFDVDTDAIGVGVEFACPVVPGMICPEAAIEYMRGSESFYTGDGFYLKSNGIVIDDKIKYSVLQFKVHGKYPFAMNDDESLSFTPIVGPGVYRWKYVDCPFGFGCSETLFVLDVGAGVRYNNFGFDLYTQLNGPNLSGRLRYVFAK